MTDITNISITSENLCCICWANMENIYNTKCKHSFHKICIDKWLENNTTCPICRTVIKNIKPINVSNNIVVPINININIPPIQAEEQNQRIIPITENSTFLKFLISGYIISNIYNIIMLFLCSNYIDDYYNERISRDAAIFMVVDILLIVSLPATIIKKLHNNCAFLSMMILYIILIVCYIYYYKDIFSCFNILSLGLKINFTISSLLHIFFNICNLLTAHMVHWQLVMQ